MKKISFVVFVLAPILIFSQSYKKGYFLDNSGQKTECFISSDVLLYSPEVIDYRLDVSAQTQSKSIRELKEVVLYDLIQYKKFTVNADFSSSKLDELTNFKELTLVQKELFLEVIEKGKLLLYHYKRPSFSRFFYAKNENEVPDMLDYKKYLSGTNENIILTNEFYKQELLNAMFDGGIVKSDIDNIGYYEKDLAKLFRRYNSSFNSVEELDNKGKEKALKFALAVKPKFSFSLMKMEFVFDSPNAVGFYSPANFSNTVPEIGVEFEGYLYQGFTAYLGVSHFNFKDTSNQIIYGVASPNTNFNAAVNFEALKVALGIRKYFSLDPKEKLAISIHGGLSWFNVINKVENATIVKPARVVNSNTIAPHFGVGVRFLKTYFAEVTYEPKRNISSDYQFSRSDLSIISLTLATDLVQLLQKK